MATLVYQFITDNYASCFTCGKRKICSTIKNSQDIMNIIVTANTGGDFVTSPTKFVDNLQLDEIGNLDCIVKLGDKMGMRCFAQFGTICTI